MIAKDTYILNTYFRSRLEAKWAVYFHLLGVKWEYEPVKFELQNGDTYIPDFYFPDYDFYAEVKPLQQEDVRWSYFDAGLVLMFGSPHAKPMPSNMRDERGFGVCPPLVIPFYDLVEDNEDKFWYCGGDEDMSNISPFKESIRAANMYRFESRQPVKHISECIKDELDRKLNELKSLL